MLGVTKQRGAGACVCIRARVCELISFTILRARPSPQLSPALPPGSPAYGPPGNERHENMKLFGSCLIMSDEGHKVHEQQG